MSKLHFEENFLGSVGFLLFDLCAKSMLEEDNKFLLLNFWKENVSNCFWRVLGFFLTRYCPVDSDSKVEVGSAKESSMSKNVYHIFYLNGILSWRTFSNSEHSQSARTIDSLSDHLRRCFIMCFEMNSKFSIALK